MKNETPYIDIHTHTPTGSDGIIEFQSHSIGIHPWSIATANIEDELKCLQTIDCSFFGEIGIDNSLKTPLPIQREILVAQLQVANRRQIPVIIHAVKSHSEVVAVLKRTEFKQLILIHGFVGSKEELHSYMQFNVSFSFGAAIFNSNKTVEALQSLPIKQLFLETDDQSQYSIQDIYKKACSILNTSEEELKSVLYQNYLNTLGEKYV